ncbi:MAG: helix-turn-helix domain-containing protein [Saprospiraceae bacterium]|nr:helix-turn-helix domain-containing protein [Saprospiraceae bacterium]
MKLSLLDLILFAGIIQGIFLFISLRKAQYSNWFLVSLLLLAVWLQIEFLAVRNTTLFKIPFLYSSRYGIWLLAGPLLYFYIKSFSDKDFTFKRRDSLHFLAGFIFIIILPVLLNDLIPYRGIHYGMLTVLKYPQMGLTTIQSIYGAVFVLQFLHCAAYIFYAHRLVNKINKELFAKQYDWLKKIITAAVILLLCSIAFYILIIYSDLRAIREMDYLYVIPFAGFIYWINYQVIKKPFLFRDDLKWFKHGKKYEKSSLTQDKAASYLEALEAYMQAEKPYLDEALKLTTVATTLNIPEHHLSQALNEKSGKSFYDYITKFRIEEAKKQLLAKGNKSILEIAYEVGFNNKTSFNKHFKKETGMTPSEFLKKN